VKYTAFAPEGRKKGQDVTARLIVRRVRDLSRDATRGQGEMFPAWRYHALFTDSPSATIQAEEQHRDHAQVEQVLADWTDGPLATCRRAHSPPTQPGSPAPPSAATSCAPPGHWPASPMPKPAAPRCAATSSTSPPAPPGTAAATSPCTCPLAGTANRSGGTCSRPPPARPCPDVLTSPDPVTAHPSPASHPGHDPDQDLRTSRKTVSGSQTTPPETSRSRSAKPGSRTQSHEIRRWIEA
jgi:hypothetical protein